MPKFLRSGRALGESPQHLQSPHQGKHDEEPTLEQEEAFPDPPGFIRTELSKTIYISYDPDVHYRKTRNKVKREFRDDTIPSEDIPVDNAAAAPALQDQPAKKIRGKRPAVVSTWIATIIENGVEAGYLYLKHGSQLRPNSEGGNRCLFYDKNWIECDKGFTCSLFAEEEILDVSNAGIFGDRRLIAVTQMSGIRGGIYMLVSNPQINDGEMNNSLSTEQPAATATPGEDLGPVDAPADNDSRGEVPPLIRSSGKPFRYDDYAGSDQSWFTEDPETEWFTCETDDETNNWFNCHEEAELLNNQSRMDKVEHSKSLRIDASDPLERNKCTLIDIISDRLRASSIDPPPDQSAETVTQPQENTPEDADSSFPSVIENSLDSPSKENLNDKKSSEDNDSKFVNQTHKATSKSRLRLVALKLLRYPVEEGKLEESNDEAANQVPLNSWVNSSSKPLKTYNKLKFDQSPHSTEPSTTHSKVLRKLLEYQKQDAERKECEPAHQDSINPCIRSLSRQLRNNDKLRSCHSSDLKKYIPCDSGTDNSNLVQTSKRKSRWESLEDYQLRLSQSSKEENASGFRTDNSGLDQASMRDSKWESLSDYQLKINQSEKINPNNSAAHQMTKKAPVAPRETKKNKSKFMEHWGIFEEMHPEQAQYQRKLAIVGMAKKLKPEVNFERPFVPLNAHDFRIQKRFYKYIKSSWNPTLTRTRRRSIRTNLRSAFREEYPNGNLKSYLETGNPYR